MGLFNIFGSSGQQVFTGYSRFEILPYQDNELGYAHWQGFLANFSSIKEKIIFQIEGNAAAIKLFLYAPDKYATYIENVFYSNFPTCDLIVRESNMTVKLEKQTYLEFVKGASFFDTAEFSKGGSYVDPFKDLLSMYFGIPEQAHLSLNYVSMFDVKDSIWKKIWKLIKRLWKGKADKNEKDEDRKDQQQQKKDDEVKYSGRDVEFSVCYRLRGVKGPERKTIQQNIEHGFDKFLETGKIKPTKKKVTTFANVNQFVNLFHMPTKTNQNKSLSYIPYRKLAYPVNIPTLENTSEEEITLLGTTNYKNSKKTFGIKKEDKFRHVYIVGKTGMGKSTFMSNMVRSDMIRNNGLAVVDPHGDLIEDVMAHIPSHRTNDVIVFDVSDTKFPVGFNILEYNNEDEKNLVASAVVSIFKKLYGDSWGPRLEYILRNVMLSVLEYPNATLMHIVRMLTDKNFREEVLAGVTDPVILKFWRDEFDTWQEKQRNEAIGPISNKIGQFLSSPIVRNIFAQPKSSLQIRKIMDEGKILLVNLSKGKVGEDNASMIGSFLVSKFQIDAMSRADISFKQRRDFYLYIDEFQNFATDSFESILSEARKYRLSLIVANQYTSQIQENVRNAIFGNVGSVVSFGLGYDDATMMSQQFKEIITANDLLSLPKFTAYTKLMVDGVTTDPFTMNTFPLPEPTASEEIKEKIRKQSRQRYSMEREKLEELLKAWSSKQFTKTEKVMEKAEQLAKQEQSSAGGGTFSIDDVQVGERYDGLVKLKYNYGVFVTVKGVEGLLHKSQIDKPANVSSRKDLYAIGDKIKVKVSEFKEIDGVKRVVWTQLS